MNLNAKPVCDYGDRNIFCPYYDDCLDYVVDCDWEAWNCASCPYNQLRYPIIETEGTIDHEIPYYELTREWPEELDVD